MNSTRQVDRRRFARAVVMGSAIVLAAEAERYVDTYGLENLSASGALLVGNTNLPIRKRIRLLLQLHHGPGCFALEASIVRRSKRGAQSVFAVQFVNVSAAVEDALQSAVLHQLTRRHEVVLIIDAAGASDAAWLERDIHELGGETVVVPTALGAIAWLQAPEVAVGTVIANGAPVSMDGLSLLEFLELDYPSIRRVLACSADFAWAHHDAATSGRVHAYLEKPWTRESLRQALGMPDGGALLPRRVSTSGICPRTEIARHSDDQS